jgi:hypothetical protein
MSGIKFLNNFLLDCCPVCCLQNELAIVVVDEEDPREQISAQ